MVVGKLVVLKFGDGSFEQGFPVTLQIGEDEQRPSVEITGWLPPAPELPQYYSGWTKAYYRLGLPSRLEASVVQVTNVSKIESCTKAAQVLRDRLHKWLCCPSFCAIREKLLEQLVPSDEIRLIIQTENSLLRRLPWHLWDFCDRYPKVEIALSAPIYEGVKQLSPLHRKVRILAILGNSVGINTQADRQLLEQLPDAEVRFLVEPQRHELTEELWSRGWDILFFAGHSSSQENGATGRIYINQTDSLTIDQLKYALKKAVERGLKIAIFNSCEGLGLAGDLADLKIPQIIVMREPVPDQVCQEFLKYFLEAFARGESFYLAVREARERLQGLEDQFPCATWLPMICQNPAISPPTWHGLGGRFLKKAPPDPDWRRSLSKVFLLSLGLTSLLMGVRWLGMLQPLELNAFDQLTRQRPEEKPDPRLLVITVTESDVQAQDQAQRRGGSLSDVALNQVLQKLEPHQPRAIGLDIYRSFPVDSERKDLATRLQQSDRFIAVCKVSSPDVGDPGVPPPPEVPKERLGFSDFVTDSDGIVRRHLLAMTPDPASPCTTSYAFSTQLAFRYLAAEGILPKFNSDGVLELGNVIFQPVEAYTGGYQRVDAGGHQVLLNYRFYRSPENIAAQVTLQDVLEGKLNPDSIKDRIVLIGTSAKSFRDYWLTPYSQGHSFEAQIPGVLVQAQMVSQILSTVLDQRPLLWAWPEWGEALWIWGWSLTGGLLAWRVRSPLHLGLAIAVAQIGLYGFCFGLLTQSGCWVPLVPSALALLATSSSVAAYKTVQARRQQLILKL